MKKARIFDTKGFMLVETLLVSLTVSGILVYMYAQFSTINSAYQKLYDYNTSSSLYRAAAFREFVMTYTSASSSIYNGLTAKTLTCDRMGLSTNDKNYCSGIYSALDIKQVILTVDQFDYNAVLNTVSDSTTKAQLSKFLNTIKRHNTTKKRLIVIFNDETMATVLFRF